MKDITKKQIKAKYEEALTESKEFMETQSRDWNNRMEKFSDLLDSDIYNDENKADWQSKKIFNHLKTVVEILIGRIDDIEFPAPKGFSNISANQLKDNNAQFQANALQRLVEHLLFMGGFWDIKKTVINESVLFGGSFVKLIYCEKTKTIKQSWRTIQNAYLDKNATVCLEDSNYLGEWYTELLGDIINNNNYDESVRNQIKKDLLEGGGINFKSMTSSSTNDSRQMIKSTDRAQYRNDSSVMSLARINEFRLKWFDEETMKMRWVIINVIEGTDYVLRIDWYDDGLNDIVFFPYKKQIYTFLGNGVVTPDVMSLQDAINDILNLGIDNAKLSTFPILAMEEAFLSAGEKLTIRPAEIIKIPTGASGKLVPISLAPPNYQLLIMKLNWLKEAIEETVGITRESTGGTIRSSERSAEQAKIRNTSSEKRMLSNIREFESGTIKLIGKMVYMIKTYLPQSSIDKILGLTIIEEDGEMIDELTGRRTPFIGEQRKEKTLDKKDLDDFKFNYSIQGVESYAGEREIDEKIDNILGQVERFPELKEDPEVDYIGLIKTLMIRSKIPEIQKYITINETDEENVSIEDLEELGALQQLEGQSPQLPELPIEGDAFGTI